MNCNICGTELMTGGCPKERDHKEEPDELSIFLMDSRKLKNLETQIMSNAKNERKK